MTNKINRLTSYVIRLGGRYLALTNRVAALESENKLIIEVLKLITEALLHQNTLVALLAEQSVCQVDSIPVGSIPSACSTEYKDGTYVGPAGRRITC